jgi:hypothetical protein
MVQRISELVREPILIRLDWQDRVLAEMRSELSRERELLQLTLDDHRMRIESLEADRRRTFWIWGVVAGGLTALFNALWIKLRVWLGLE